MIRHNTQVKSTIGNESQDRYQTVVDTPKSLAGMGSNGNDLMGALAIILLSSWSVIILEDVNSALETGSEKVASDMHRWSEASKL